VSITGNVSANRFIGDGSQLTGVTAASADRITSGTTQMVVVSSSGFVSLTQAGTNTGWFDPTRGLVTLGVSATGPISGSAGYFAGNVGIGTTSPGERLTIHNGNIRLSGDGVGPSRIEAIGNRGITIAAGGNQPLILDSSGGQTNLTASIHPSGTFTVRSSAITDNLTVQPAIRSVIIGDGNTANSSQQLWTLRARTSNGNTAASDFLIQGAQPIGSNRNGGNLWIAPGSPHGTGSPGNIVLGFNGTNHLGNVGIGTTNPSTTLHVSGSFTVSNSSQTNNPSLYVGTNGNVGVGTANAQVPLEVSGTIKLSGLGTELCNSPAHWGRFRMNPTTGAMEICRQ
jgi:hypothetical protein